MVRYELEKAIFNNEVDYRIWKINMQDGLENASYYPVNQKINTKKQNLFLIMPFRIKDDEEQLSKWLFHNFVERLDRYSKSALDVLAHYHIDFQLLSDTK